MKRKIITILLSLAMVLAYAIPYLNTDMQAYAASNPYPWWNDNAQTERSCTSFAWQCVYDRQGIALPAWGNAVTWWQGAKNAGISTGSIPAVGAVAVWNGGAVYNGQKAGHVAYVTKVTNNNTFTVDEGGRSDVSGGIAYGYTLTNAVGAVRPYTSDQVLLGFIYPGGAPKWWMSLTPVDLGSEFYANIGLHHGDEKQFNSMGVNANTYNVGFVGGNDPTEDVDRVCSDSYKSRFWYYQRNNDDGSYRISNCLYTGCYLTAEGNTDGSNVKIVNGFSSKDDSQKWFIYGQSSGEYIFRNAASDCVLWYNTSYNLQIRTKNSTYEYNEKVQTYPFEPISGTSTLTVNATTADKDTVFTWTKPTGNVAWYNIWINQLDSAGNETADLSYLAKNMLADNTQSISTKKIRLDAGRYKAKIVPHAWTNALFPDYVYFTVNEASSACSHSNTEIRGRVEATCTTDGYSGDKICKDCGATISKGSKIAATGHDWSAEYTIDKAATCTEAGSKSKHCKNCGEKSDVTAIPATGHNFGEWKTIDTGGCESGGARQHTCTVCGFTETESLNPDGHDWADEYTVDVEPTCTESGSRSRHCNKCSATTDSQIIPALGHNYGEWITDNEATCTANGSKHRECSRCGDVITGTIPTSGHEWAADYTVDEKATCTEAGTKSIHCIVCDAVKPGSSVEIPAGAHEFGSWTITKAATCTKDGEQQRECRLCGHTETMTISAQGHEWNEGTIKEKPSCTEDGIKTITCLGCGEEKDDFIPALGHNWDEEYTIDVQATCVEEGQRSIHCLRCEKVQTSSIEVIPRKPHNVSAWTTVKEPTCIAEGVREGDCLSCHNKVQEPIAKTDHVWGTDYKVDKAATYGAAGSKSHHCTVCDTIQPGSQVAIARLAVKGTTLRKPKAIKKGFTAKWVKGTDVTGYEIQYALNSKFTKSKKTVKVQSASTVSKKIKKLKSKKKYYIRIRTYKVENGNTYYSAWSAKKTVKTK